VEVFERQALEGLFNRIRYGAGNLVVNRQDDRFHRFPIFELLPALGALLSHGMILVRLLRIGKLTGKMKSICNIVILDPAVYSLED
jgi:hypothetical protein